MTNLRGQAAPWGPLASQAGRREASKHPGHSRPGECSAHQLPAGWGQAVMSHLGEKNKSKGAGPSGKKMLTGPYTFSQGLWTTHRPGPTPTSEHWGWTQGKSVRLHSATEGHGAVTAPPQLQ